MKQELIPLSSKARWEEALQGIKHDFAHTWDNCHAMQLTTGYKTYLYVFQDGPVKIVCPLAERFYNGYTDVLTPYGFSGFVGNYDLLEFQSYWQQYLKSCGYICGYISINPLFENSMYLESENVCNNNSLYYLDLRLSVEELFKNLDRNRKRQLKKLGYNVS